MSRAQRLTFLGLAVVIAVIAVVLITSGDSTTDTAASPTSTPSATPAQQQQASPIETQTPEPTPTAAPVKTLEAGKVTKLEVTQGDTVRFKVASDVPEEVHVHGYDRYVDVAAGKAASESFKADITGVFEIEFHGSGEEIGRLSVVPR